MHGKFAVKKIRLKSKRDSYQRKIPGGYSIFEMIVTKRVVKWCKVHEAGWFDDFGEFLFSGS